MQKIHCKQWKHALRSRVCETSQLLMNSCGFLANPRKKSRFILSWLIVSTVSWIYGNQTEHSSSSPTASTLSNQTMWSMHTVSNTPCLKKKLCKLIFCQNFAKFRWIVKTFGTKIAERTGFSAVYSFSTSPNLCQYTTVWNADVQNCYVTLLVCSKLSNDLISTQ